MLGIHLHTTENMVTPTRFERVTPRLGIWCSILLSYGTTEALAYKSRGFLPSVFSLAGWLIAGFHPSARGFQAPRERCAGGLARLGFPH